MRGIHRCEILIAASGTGSANVTMVYVTAPATMILEIINVRLAAKLSATNQQMAFAWDRITTLGAPSGGTSILTGSGPAEVGGASPAAAAFTGKYNPSSEPTTYAGLRLAAASVPSIAGYDLRDTEERIIVPPSGSIGLLLLTGTYASISLYGSLDIKEIG